MNLIQVQVQRLGLRRNSTGIDFHHRIKAKGGSALIHQGLQTFMQHLENALRQRSMIG